MPLSRSQLEAWILRALDPEQNRTNVLSAVGEKPIRVLLHGDLDVSLLRIYGWNVTHGGATRSPNEFRIQMTGARPEIVPGEQTLIVGWSETFEVFAAWDPIAHQSRTSTSPSLQVHQDTLVAAYDSGLAAETRGSGDVAVAFRPGLFAAYAAVAQDMHQVNSAQLTSEINLIPSAVASSTPRSRVSRVVETHYRAWDFSERVNAAYNHTCAVCGQQLALVEAAHIVPVAWPGSTDETRNGICLCRNHHRAFDASLINIEPDRTIRVSTSRLRSLGAAGRDQGAAELLRFDRKPLASMPAAVPDWPHSPYLLEGAKARRWRP